MSATQNQINLVSLKLNVLEDERKQLHTDLDTYVDEVIAMGQQFVDSGGQEGPHFKDISQSIEQALMSVMDKRIDYSFGRHNSEVNSSSPLVSQVSMESNFTSPKVTAVVQACKTSTRRNSFNNKIIQTTLYKVINCVKYYMDNVDSEVKSHRCKLDVLSAMIPQIMKEINELKTQMEATEELKCKQTELDNRVTRIETDERLQFMKLQIDAMETSLPKVDSRVTELKEDFLNNKQDHMTFLQNLEHHCEVLDKKQSVTENKVLELAKLLTTNEENLNTINESLMQKSKDLDKITDRVTKTEKEADMTKKQNEDRVERDSVTMTDLENRLRKQEEKWNDREMKNIRKMEDKLQRLDAERKKDVYFMGDNIEKIMSKIDDMKTTENTMSTKLDIVEKRQKRPVGFSAKLSLSFTTPTKKTVMRDFTDIVTNRGDHFQPQTGEFTAPLDGLYVIALMHRQWQDGEIWLVVLQSSNTTGSVGKEKSVCETRTDISRTSSNSVSVVWMNAGDKIWVNVRNIKGTDIWIDAPSSFSCFLIG